MPTRQGAPTRQDLFGLVQDELHRSITKPNILSYVPYPEQRLFHECDKSGRYIAGGNRGGKTDAIVVDAILWATDTNPFRDRPEHWGHEAIQLRFIVVDVEKGVNQIILPKLKRWCAPSMLIDGRFDKSWDPKALMFTFSNGSTIDFLTHGMDLDKHGGVPRHIVYFDEEPPQAIFNENMMRLIDFDGWWVIAATAVQGMGWTYDLLWEPAETLIGQGKYDEAEVGIFTLSAAKNPYLKAETFDRFMIGMSKEERQIRESGEFVAKSGLVFPQFGMNLDKFILDDHLTPDKSWDWYSSADFGYNNPTAWLWHAVGPKGQIYTFAEHYRSGLTTPEHAGIVKEREGAWGKEPETRVGDPAGNQRQGNTGTSYITEYAMKGIYIGTEGIPHEVQIGIEKMQQYTLIRPDSPWGRELPTWRISPNCPNLIREMKKLRWKSYTSDKMAYTLNKQEEVHKKDDHAFDSTRYFFTLMPDLTPITREWTPEQGPQHLTYEDMMARMALDPDVEFVDDVRDPNWTTTTEFGDYYEQDYA